MMHDTIYAAVDSIDQAAITKSVEDMVASVQSYVPGYRMKMPPTFDDRKVTVMLEIEGAGDYLPTYSGNLDIMTAAAVAVGERIAEKLQGESDG
jgi:acetaldehyde dehydrogenase